MKNYYVPSLDGLKKVKEIKTEVNKFDTWLIVLMLFVFWPVSLVFLIINMSGEKKAKYSYRFKYENGQSFEFSISKAAHIEYLKQTLMTENIKFKAAK